jgi:hypothetical protein
LLFLRLCKEAHRRKKLVYTPAVCSTTINNRVVEL